MNASDEEVLKELGSSRIFKDYQEAFSEKTGLPLELNATNTGHLPPYDRRYDNTFCVAMVRDSKACLACQEVVKKITDKDNQEPVTVECFAGLSDSAVPITRNGETIAFLQTGHFFLRQPTPDQFEEVEAFLNEIGSEVETGHLKKHYYDIPVVSPEKHHDVLTLLKTFADHLSSLAMKGLLGAKPVDPTGYIKKKHEDLAKQRNLTAALLSVWPGLGHLYKGYRIPGIMLMIFGMPVALWAGALLIYATFGLSLAVPLIFWIGVAVHAFITDDLRKHHLGIL